ncbi:MAG: hypothetical protein H0U13_03880 [Gemmatimonadaceae bacterium]|nr:hypothetical protein [Gemmatimonadaceae bacterium]
MIRSVRRKLGFLAGGVLMVVSACTETVTPADPSELAAVSATELSDTVGLQVSPAPSVIVRDERGHPLQGVPVRFAVTSGGGTVVGEAAETDSSGVAAVISWRLGRATGVNTLTATVGDLPPVMFTARAIAGWPVTMSRIAGDGQTVIAGSPVSVRPAVLLRDIEGNLVSGATVMFEGDGVMGANQITGEDGIATVGGWAPPRIGIARLDVRSGFLFNSFTAIARTGPPATLTKVAGDMQSAPAGTAVARRPEVLVRDAALNLVPGVSVVFAVETGGGTVVNGSQTTSAGGASSPSTWILGAVGPQSLSATVSGLPPVVFTATATVPP